MKNFLNKLKTALQKEYDIDSHVTKLFKSVKERALNACAKLNIVLHKEINFDFYAKKAVKAVIKNTKSACVKFNLILHKEFDLDYYVIKYVKAINASLRRTYPKVKAALQREYDIDSYVKEALTNFAFLLLKLYRLSNSSSRLIMRAAAVISIKTHIIFIGLSKFVVLKRIIIRDAIKNRRNNKIKARLDQERENIAFLTEFLNSLKEEFGADISFSLVSVNNDEGSFDVINEH